MQVVGLGGDVKRSESVRVEMIEASSGGRGGCEELEDEGREISSAGHVKCCHELNGDCIHELGNNPLNC